LAEVVAQEVAKAERRKDNIFLIFRILLINIDMYQITSDIRNLLTECEQNAKILILKL